MGAGGGVVTDAMKIGADELVADALPRLAGVGAVVEGEDRFLGTITDASVRRRLLIEDDWSELRCGDLLDEVPVAVAPGASDDEVRALLADRNVRLAAVVDGDRFVGQTTVAPSLPEVIAVALAGGKGERLQPLTFKVPKPLLQVGRTSILERTLEGLHASRVDDVYLAVSYMAEMIEDRIGDGSMYGLRVQYLREESPLGSAGPLSLLPSEPSGPVIITNTDQITNMSVARLVDYHVTERADVTVAAFMHEIDLKYGVFDLQGTELVGLREKPTLRVPCNAGYYVVDPAAMAHIPRGQLYTAVDLMHAVMRSGGRVAVFPMVETWIDIGTPDELEKALLWSATGEET
jgi:dTDP-glucose pyrophosphorylase